MPIFQLVLFLFVVAAGSAYAHKDRIEHPHTLTVTFKSGESVTFTTSNNVVNAISVRIGTKTYSVPKSVCVKFRDIRFETTELLWNGSYKTPATADYFYVRFDMGTENARTFGELPRVQVMFREGKFAEVSVTKKTAEDTWGRFEL